jgi:hypothetical protein
MYGVWTIGLCDSPQEHPNASCPLHRFLKLEKTMAQASYQVSSL